VCLLRNCSPQAVAAQQRLRDLLIGLEEVRCAATGRARCALHSPVHCHCARAFLTRARVRTSSGPRQSSRLSWRLVHVFRPHHGHGAACTGWLLCNTAAAAASGRQSCPSRQCVSCVPPRRVPLRTRRPRRASSRVPCRSLPSWAAPSGGSRVTRTCAPRCSRARRGARAGRRCCACGWTCRRIQAAAAAAAAGARLNLCQRVGGP
jgi:hypothetical protein